MPKNTVFTLCLLAMCTFGLKAQGAPCYGTRFPQEGTIVAGVQSYSLLSRYLEDDFGKVRSLQHFLLISYGLTDWLSLDLKGGAGNIKQRPTTQSEIDYTSSFSGGYGFRVKLYEDENNLKAVCGFQHISVHPKKIHVNSDIHEAILDDWQASLLVSKDIGKVTPYLGVKWSRVDYIHKMNDVRKRRMSDLTKSLGGVLGLDIPFNEKTYLNLEAHFFDEQAFSIALLYAI